MAAAAQGSRADEWLGNMWYIKEYCSALKRKNSDTRYNMNGLEDNTLNEIIKGQILYDST